MSYLDDELEFAATELVLKEALHKSKSLHPQLRPTAYCHNCDEKLDATQKLFCDADCREDWEKRNRKI